MSLAIEFDLGSVQQDRSGPAPHSHEAWRTFKQFAITADIIFESYNSNEAFERFTEEGPFALLPFSDNAMNMVWCLDERAKKVYSSLSDGELISLIQKKYIYFYF